MDPLYKKEDVIKLLGHKLKVIEIKETNYGYTYKLSCYESGCCTIPFNLTITLHEKDILKYEEIL